MTNTKPQVTIGINPTQKTAIDNQLPKRSFHIVDSRTTQETFDLNGNFLTARSATSTRSAPKSI
jgi:hypothetical protein